MLLQQSNPMLLRGADRPYGIRKSYQSTSKANILQKLIVSSCESGCVRSCFRQDSYGLTLARNLAGPAVHTGRSCEEEACLKEPSLISLRAAQASDNLTWVALGRRQQASSYLCKADLELSVCCLLRVLPVSASLNPAGTASMVTAMGPSQRVIGDSPRQYHFAGWVESLRTKTCC